MWIYGIKLILTESAKERNTNIFNYDVIQTFLSNIDGKDRRREAQIAKQVLERFDTQEIMSNEQFCQTNMETLALDSLSNSLEYKNGIVHRDNEKEGSNYVNDCKKLDVDIRTYIDEKFHNMERRLAKKMDEIEANTNKKLDAILERLETQLRL